MRILTYRDAEIQEYCYIIIIEIQGPRDTQKRNIEEIEIDTEI